MPRKKKPQPGPSATFEFDGLVVEIYADRDLPKGRGLHGQYLRMQTLHLALEVLLESRDNSNIGIQRQLFVDMRRSAIVLEKELTKKYGRRHSTQIQQRICRSALRIFAESGDDEVRLPYVLRRQIKQS